METLQIDLQSAKERFLKRYGVEPGDLNRAFSKSWKAAVEHNKTYAKDVAILKRKEIRDYARDLSNAFIATGGYGNEKWLCQAIVRINDDITDRFSPDLHRGEMRIGTTQKFINVYLKYQWCMGLIDEPAHCPVDRIVQGSAGVGITRLVNWTEIEEVSEYVSVVETLKKQAQAKGMSLAQWEILEGFPTQQI